MIKLCLPIITFMTFGGESNMFDMSLIKIHIPIFNLNPPFQTSKSFWSQDFRQNPTIVTSKRFPKGKKKWHHFFGEENCSHIWEAEIIWEGICIVAFQDAINYICLLPKYLDWNNKFHHQKKTQPPKKHMESEKRRIPNKSFMILDFYFQV